MAYYEVLNTEGVVVNTISAAAGITNDHLPYWFTYTYPGFTLRQLPDVPPPPDTEPDPEPQNG